MCFKQGTPPDAIVGSEKQSFRVRPKARVAGSSEDRNVACQANHSGALIR
jgi:hypothetical protein